MFAQQGGQALQQCCRVAGGRAIEVERRSGRGTGACPGITALRQFLARGGRAPGAAWPLGVVGTLGAVLEGGQYTGIDQALVQGAIYSLQAEHHMLVEQSVENGLDLQLKWAGCQGLTKGQGNLLWVEGVVVLAQLLPVVEQGQTLLQSK